MFPAKAMLFTMVAICCGLQSEVEAQTRPARKYALIVGVKQYRPQQDLPELPYAEPDAHDMAQVLERAGFNVTLLSQQRSRDEKSIRFQPMADLIRDEFKALVQTPFLTEQDVVLVALAGHGIQLDQPEVTGRRKAAFYFCPADADVKGLKSSTDVTDRHHLLSVDELYATLDDCQAGTRLLLVDACRNDPSKPSGTRTLNSVTLPPMAPPPGGMAAFFGCSATQKAFEDPTLGHGVFFSLRDRRSGRQGRSDGRQADQRDGVEGIRRGSHV